MYGLYGLKNDYHEWVDDSRTIVATFDKWQDAEAYIVAATLKQKGVWGPFRAASLLSTYDGAEVDTYDEYPLPHNPEPDWFKKGKA